MNTTTLPNISSGANWKQLRPVLIVPVGTGAAGDPIVINSGQWEGETMRLETLIRTFDFQGQTLEAWTSAHKADEAPRFDAKHQEVLAKRQAAWDATPQCARCGCKTHDLYNTATRGAVCGSCWGDSGAGIED